MIKPADSNQPTECKMIHENTKYTIITFYSLFLILSSFLFNTPGEILTGLKNILLTPGILITDYIAIGNIGSALMNSGILMLLSIIFAHKNKAHMNGTLIAAIFTVAGFSFFGKNLYNGISIIIGIYIHSLIQKEKFSKYVLISLFGTSLGPLVSQITFGLGLPIYIGILAGNAAGVLAGLILPALAGHFVKFHQGFNLYNVGFACGIIGSFFMSMLRAFGHNTTSTLIVSKGNNQPFVLLFGFMFFSMAAIGFLLNNGSFRNYIRLFRHSGRLIEDFVIMDGFAVTIINMGVLGFIGMSYILMVNGELNGPSLGAIFTYIGFGAFGKHPKNTLPIILGVFLAAWLQVWDVNSTPELIAALFATTLAPITGRFGWKAGILAGFLHLTLVMNIGYLHGGINLYNNGFSGGFIAATLVPILESFRKDEIV